MLHRRSFLLGLGAAVAAPAIIRPGFLMPVKQMWPVHGDGVALQAMAHPVSVMRVPFVIAEEALVDFIYTPDAAMLRRASAYDRIYGVVLENRAGFFKGDVVTLRDINEPSSGPS